MKAYKDLIIETLNQRSVVDNRQIVDIQDVNKSVLIAFDRACVNMRDMYNWIWNYREEVYVTQADNTTYPMPYGIIKGLILSDAQGAKCALEFVPQLTAEEGCPTQWTQDWQNEEIVIAPAEKDSEHQMIIQYYDKNIAYHTDRSDSNNLMQNFDPTGSTVSTESQFLNVPANIYDVYAECVVTLARVYLNEGAQPSVFQAQQAEFNTALNSLLEFAKTPFYKAQRFEI